MWRALTDRDSPLTTGLTGTQRAWLRAATMALAMPFGGKPTRTAGSASDRGPEAARQRTFSASVPSNRKSST